MNNLKVILTTKYVAYVILLLLLYVLQTVPGLFAVYDVKPIWVIPAAVVIAMLEGEFVGGLFGAFAGLLCDMGAFTLFGFNGFFVGLCCVGIGLLIIYLMRCNLLGCLLLVFAVMIARGSLEFLFVYGMWGHDGVWRIYLTGTLAVSLYSTAVAPLLFFLFRGIYRRCEMRM